MPVQGFYVEPSKSEIADYARYLETTNKAKAIDVAAWLNGLNNGNVVSGSAKPVMVTMARKTYFGAQYQRTDDKVGVTTFYLLGDPPYQRSGHTKKVCFTNPTTPYEMFIGGHATQDTAADPRFSQYHPFGAWFSLTQWSLPEKIDAYEDRPYTRKAIEITAL